MTFERIVILLSTLVFGAIGIGFVFAPGVLAAQVGIELTSVTAHNDFRAVYGGVPAGLAIFLVLALRRTDWTLPALYVIAFTLGGLALTRFYSWLADGLPGPIAFLLHGAELSGTLLTFVAIRRARAEGAP